MSIRKIPDVSCSRREGTDQAGMKHLADGEETVAGVCFCFSHGQLKTQCHKTGWLKWGPTATDSKLVCVESWEAHSPPSRTRLFLTNLGTPTFSQSDSITAPSSKRTFTT